MIKEMVVIVILSVPIPETYVDWSINKVPTQVQLTWESGLQASYHAKIVSCETTTPQQYQMLMIEDSDFIQECYLIEDVRQPQFVRHPDQWYGVRRAQEYKE